MTIPRLSFLHWIQSECMPTECMPTKCMPTECMPTEWVCIKRNKFTVAGDREYKDQTLTV